MTNAAVTQSFDGLLTLVGHDGAATNAGREFLSIESLLARVRTERNFRSGSGIYRTIRHASFDLPSQSVDSMGRQLTVSYVVDRDEARRDSTRTTTRLLRDTEALDRLVEEQLLKSMVQASSGGPATTLASAAVRLLQASSAALRRIKWKSVGHEF